jgi:hypothetical protein
MAQGRIKRLQLMVTAHERESKASGVVICPLCDRPVPPALRDAHHLTPKSKGGVATVLMHRVCHRQIHAFFTETELARHYSDAESLRSHPEMARFIEWVRDKPEDFNPPARKSRNKGQL